MIDVKELRVGNYVYDVIEKKEIKLTLDDFQCINNFKKSNNQEHPYRKIGLNEYRLVGLGFEKGWEDEDAYPHFSNGMLTIFGTAHPNVFETNESDVPIKYLHKLKNLHYELTGYEIE